jgi:hypothetical protein
VVVVPPDVRERAGRLHVDDGRKLSIPERLQPIQPTIADDAELWLKQQP